MSLPVSTPDLPEYNLVTLVKRTLNGNGEPHVVPVADVDTIGKLLQISQRIFDTDISPRIFTENNCPIPHKYWADTLRGPGRSGQHFYLEVFEQQYTKGNNRSCVLHPAPFDTHPPSSSSSSSSSPEIRPVILVEYPVGLFSIHPLPDDLIVESISLDLRIEALADNITMFLSREFSPNADFTIEFENAERRLLSPTKTLAESGLSHGALVHCRLKLMGFSQAETESESLMTHLPGLSRL